MTITRHNINGKDIPELTADQLLITDIEDRLNLLGDMYFQGFDTFIIHEQNITPDFFDLKNGIAGEILQKFSTYRMALVVIGDFSKYSSKSLQDFIYESNKGNIVNFVAAASEAKILS